MHTHKHLYYNHCVLNTYPICFVVSNEIYKYEKTNASLMGNCRECFLSFHKNI